MNEFYNILEDAFARQPELESMYDNKLLALTCAKNALESRPWAGHTAYDKVKLYNNGSEGWQERFLAQGYSEEEIERLPSLMPIYELAAKGV